MKGGGISYVKALDQFDAWCKATRQDLQLAEDVDDASAEYAMSLSKAASEQLLAGLNKAYPRLRGSLPTLTAIVQQKATAHVTAHHPAIPWPLLLLLADHMRLQGKARQSAFILLLWRLGVRPSDGLNLTSGDLQPPSHFGDERPIGVVLLGRARGTKTRRQAYTRIYKADSATMHFVWLMKQHTPSEAKLTRWTSSPQITAALRQACQQLGILDCFTAHSCRAGWATARHLAGQSINELLCDGTWTSESTLRIYLDVVSGPNALSHPSLAPYLERIRFLQCEYPRLWASLPPPPLQPPRTIVTG